MGKYFKNIKTVAEAKKEVRRLAIELNPTQKNDKHPIKYASMIVEYNIFLQKHKATDKELSEFIKENNLMDLLFVQAILFGYYLPRVFSGAFTEFKELRETINKKRK